MTDPLRAALNAVIVLGQKDNGDDPQTWLAFRDGATAFILGYGAELSKRLTMADKEIARLTSESMAWKKQAFSAEAALAELTADK